MSNNQNVVLNFEYICYSNTSVINYNRYLFYKGDYESMAEDLSNIDWYTLFKDLDTAEMWGVFHSELLCLIDKYVPIVNSSTAKGHSRSGWLSRVVSKAKHKAWNRYHFTRQTFDYQIYSKARNHCTSLVRKAKLSFEENLAYSISTNPKKFWNYVNQNLRVKPGIPMLQQRDGSFTDNDNDVANLLNDYFCSVFTSEDLSTIPTLPPRNFKSTLSDIQLTPDDVLLQLQRLQPHKSAGPDQCHPCVLYNVRHSIITPITLIFDQSLKEGCLPGSWREATVVAIHKKGSKTDASNYRPVSLTSVVCKMLESIIKDHIM